MPIWYQIAIIGSSGYESHKVEQSLKENRLSRIDSFRDVQQDNSPASLSRSGSYGTLVHPKSPSTSSLYQKQTIGQKVYVKPIKSANTQPEKPEKPQEAWPGTKKEDSQENPQLYDYIVAICFMIFGVVAFFAGILSLYVEVSK
eukprot:CAMPEP_0116850494 /NCGR_PEP_ID=MMETSP0418-20121206/16185_1 /TAXON_ID=1158023 /ORGANISM="Astrosyne radiata, Strain 13vi08-1A" /LENGTH=143 /DNA_ID=CAMNT_0004482385 /DNA_START=135 /DNA_END=566 /DNA_ORIENTATION=+